MIAVDTNVALRLILDDEDSQVAAIRALMQRERLFVSLTVLLEMGWVLQSRYRMPKADVANALAHFIELERVEVARVELAHWAIARYRNGADWADMVHLVSAAKLDGFVTLDRRLARDAGASGPVPIEALA